MSGFDEEAHEYYMNCVENKEKKEKKAFQKKNFMPESPAHRRETLQIYCSYMHCLTPKMRAGKLFKKYGVRPTPAQWQERRVVLTKNQMQWTKFDCKECK